MDDGQERAAGGPAGVEDALLRARVVLDDVLDLPLEQRAPVFERVHATVTEELRQLELG